MHIPSAAALLTFATLASAPCAYSQPAAFVEGLRALEQTAAAGPIRAEDRGRTAARLRAALTEWDRQLDAMRARGVEMGLAYRTRGRLGDALREFDAAAARQPESSDVQLLRALTLEKLGRTSDAAQAFRAAWSLDATNLVKAYYVAQRTANADADRVRARRTLVDAYSRLDGTSDAPPTAPFLGLDPVPDTLSLAPVIGDHATAEAFALLQAGRLDDAVASLQRSPPGVVDATSPREHFARGQQAEAENRVGDARREYEATMPGVLAGRAALWVGLGRLANVDGDAAAAIAAFERAVQLAPNDAQTHRELADAYASQARHDEALVELVAALLIAPRDAQAHAAVGGVFLDTGHPADAVTALTRALRLAPTRYQTHYALARAFDELGQANDAARERALFEKARLESLAERRRFMSADLEKQEAVRREQGGAK